MWAAAPRPFRGHSPRLCHGASIVIRVLTLLLACALLVGCGSKQAKAPPATTLSAPTTTAATTTIAPVGPGALQAEVASAGAGDIPDNQVFVGYAGKSFSMKFPEGWTQSGNGDNVTFRDKNNIVRVVIVAGAAPSAVAVRKEVAAL